MDITSVEGLCCQREAERLNAFSHGLSWWFLFLLSNLVKSKRDTMNSYQLLNDLTDHRLMKEGFCFGGWDQTSLLLLLLTTVSYYLNTKLFHNRMECYPNHVFDPWVYIFRGHVDTRCSQWHILEVIYLFGFSFMLEIEKRGHSSILAASSVRPPWQCERLKTPQDDRYKECFGSDQSIYGWVADSDASHVIFTQKKKHEACLRMHCFLFLFDI